MLKAFHQKWPRVDVDVQMGNSAHLLDSLQSGELDLVLVVARESTEDAHFTAALELRFEIILVSCLPDTPKSCSLLELAPFPFLLFRRGARIENLIDEYLQNYRLPPNVIMRFDSAEALKAAVVTGMGVSMLPSYAVESEITSGALRQIYQKEPRLTMPVRFLLRDAEFVSPAVGAFVSMAREKMRNASKRKSVAS